MDGESVSDTLKDNIPAELMGPIPRNVRMTGTAWLNLIAAALFFSLGAAFAISVVRTVLHDASVRDALRERGNETVGQVTDVWTQRRRVTYSFSIDGVTFTGKSYDVPGDTARSLHEGDTLQIRYIPANPNINHPAAWEDSPYSSLWLLLLATPMFMSLMLVRRFPLQRRLAMEGIAVRGTIEKSEWNGPNRGQRYATYTFRNASNDEVEIGTCPSDYFYNKELAVWVLYLPHNPRRSEVYPFPIGMFRIDQ